MEPLPLQKIVEVTGGIWFPSHSASGPVPTDGALVSEISTDTRTIPPSSVFVALRGDRFDGHAYLEEAQRRGALASIVSLDRVSSLPPAGGPYVGVDDPLGALERLGAWNRSRLRFTAIAVTGSVGKTSTKEFLATLLSDAFCVRAAPKSFNNRIGVAATLISAKPDTEVLVAELGTSAPGELSHLSRVVRPQRIVLTEIAPAHLDGFGDLDGVVRAKGEIFDGLEPGGVSFLRHGVYGFQHFFGLRKGPVVTFGWKGGDLAITECRRVSLGQVGGRGDYGYHFTLNGVENFLLPVPGRHNVANAVAAIAVARDLGLSWEDIRAGLAKCRLPPMRLHVRDVGGIVFVDDSYNANPCSMEAAIEEWTSLDATDASGRRVAVLGDMLEMGGSSRRLHEDLGKLIAKARPRLLVAVGAESRWTARSCLEASGSGEVVHFESAAEAVPFLKDRLREGDHVLVKASRRIGLDSLVAELGGYFTARVAAHHPPSTS